MIEMFQGYSWEGHALFPEKRANDRLNHTFFWLFKSDVSIALNWISRIVRPIKSSISLSEFQRVRLKFKLYM